MSELGARIDGITERIIGCAVEVHRHLKFDRQVAVPVLYKGQPVGDFRLDLLVEGAVVVEVKAVERFDPVFEAQVLTYLRATGARVGLLINFNSKLLTHGVRRFVL